MSGLMYRKNKKPFRKGKRQRGSTKEKRQGGSKVENCASWGDASGTGICVNAYVRRGLAIDLTQLIGEA